MLAGCRLPPPGTDNRSSPEPSERKTAAKTPPGSSLACKIKAPAPSPNKIQVSRSFQLTTLDRVSEPMIKTFSAPLDLMAWEPRLIAYKNPVQAASRSNAPAFTAPILSWTIHAVAGNMYSGVDVETMIISRSPGCRLATSRARNAASMANDAVV